jgi:hypothetical protein
MNLVRSTVRVLWIAIMASVLIAICFASFRVMDAMSKGVTWPHLPLAAWIGLIGTIGFSIQFIGMYRGIIQNWKGAWVPVIGMTLYTFGVVMCFAYAYMQLGIHSAEAGDTKDPTTCLYFSAVTFTTLGYGDFAPTPDARLIAAFEAFFGYLFLGTYAAAIVVLLQRLGKSDRPNQAMQPTAGRSDAPPP